MDENDPKKSDNSSNDNRRNLRREHHKYRPREHVKGDDREYGKGDRYECHDRYNRGRDRSDDIDYHDQRGYYGDRDYHDRRGHFDDLIRFTPKMYILDFEGKMHLDDFLDWLNTVERVFEFCNPPKHMKMKIMVVKLRKNASFWWENKKKRDREGKSKIVTWNKMKWELRRKYLLENYKDMYLHIQGLR